MTTKSSRASTYHADEIRPRLKNYYISDESKVVYRSKDDKKGNAFDALEWLAAMYTHVTNKGEQMVRYYCYYSNLCRSKREKQNKDDATTSIAVKYFIC